MRPEASELEREAFSSPKSWVGGWLSPILVAAATLAWCLLIYLLILDRPRDWQYGVVPYVPGETAVSTQRAPKGAAPKQVTLPARTRGGENAKR